VFRWLRDDVAPNHPFSSERGKAHNSAVALAAEISWKLIDAPAVWRNIHVKAGEGYMNADRVVGGAEAAATASDAELLEQFVTRRSEEAFASLLRRHQTMVWGVCRRMLGQHADAEDAFQAVFLVLAAKASSLRHQANLGPWLYGVTCNTALKQRERDRLRREHERRAGAASGAQASHAELSDTPDDAEVVALVDEEIQRLPEKYRSAVVLCEIEGHSREDASRMLGIPAGTLSSRLASARDRLAFRLARRGVALGTASLAVLLASSSAPAAGLTAATLHQTLAASGVAGAGVSGPVAALTQGVLHAMFMQQVKTWVAGIALALAVAAGTIWLSFVALAQGDRPANDRERIIGVWKPTSIMDNGRERPAGEAKVAITKDKIELQFGKKGRAFPYSLDPDHNPKHFNTKSADGTKDVLGIYKFEDNKLFLVINETGGGDRPTQFVSEAKSANDLLMIMERAKKE
jgi:RNA polymerase sigma factor (sigma-70 family)